MDFVLFVRDILRAIEPGLFLLVPVILLYAMQARNTAELARETAERTERKLDAVAKQLDGRITAFMDAIQTLMHELRMRAPR